MFSRGIHTVAHFSSPFLSMAEQHSTLWICAILFIHSPLDGRLGCYLFLAVMPNAAVNLDAQVFACTCVFISLGYITVNGLDGSSGDTMFNFFEELPNCFPLCICGGSLLQQR